MSAATTPIEALSRIPGWDDDTVTCAELKGGLTNRTYVVERCGHKAILRLDAKHTGAFDLDRQREMSVLAPAALRSLAPDILFSDVEEGILLSEFIAGRTWTASDLDDSANLEALAGLLHEVHALPSCGVAFDANRIARRYVENLSSNHNLHAFGIRCQDIIADIEANDDLCCCHNDLVVENIISASRLVLLDWEYACDNDPLFDLASLIGYHDLSQETARNFLGAYSPEPDSEMAERLDEQIRLYDAIQWLWLANRHMITRTPAQAVRLEKLQQRIS